MQQPIVHVRNVNTTQERALYPWVRFGVTPNFTPGTRFTATLQVGGNNIHELTDADVRVADGRLPFMGDTPLHLADLMYHHVSVTLRIDPMTVGPVLPQVTLLSVPHAEQLAEESTLQAKLIGTTPVMERWFNAPGFHGSQNCLSYSAGAAYLKYAT